LSKPRLDQNKVHLHKAKSFNNLRAKASKWNLFNQIKKFKGNI
jgi:hypothetical protein